MEPQLKECHLRSAADAFEKAAALAPHEPLYAAQLARIFATLNRKDDAARWAGRALDINQDLHLDPLRQFGPAELSELRDLRDGAGQPPPAPPQAPPP